MEIRKNHKSLSEGKLTHFYPFDNVYVYFRETNDESAMIIVNGSDKESEVDLNKYKETLAKILKIENIRTNEVTDITQNKKIIIKKKSAEIFLLIK